MKTSRTLVLLVIPAAFLAACYHQSTGTTDNNNPIPTSLVQTINTVSQDDVKQIDVEAGSFYYTPNQITVKKGQKIKIVLHSVSMMHDFNIDELQVKLPIVKNGETGTVEFVADRVGKFEYYCSVGQHRQMGQIGTLIVEE